MLSACAETGYMRLPVPMCPRQAVDGASGASRAEQQCRVFRHGQGKEWEETAVV